MSEQVFLGNPNSLTLHIRISKKCNADCSYCSSFEKNASDLMDITDLQKSLSFIKNKILELGIGGNRDHLTVQYIGGELLTIPTSYLKEFSELVKKELSPIFKDFRHGGQSNLIGSPKKINSLYEILDNNIGTSFDLHTTQRTVNKDPKKYKTIFMKNVSHVKKYFGKNISGIIVLDKKMYPHIKEEIQIHNSSKRHLTIRPVFNGGSPIESLTLEEIELAFVESYSNWIMKQQIIIEPFYSYLNKRIHTHKNLDISHISGCPSQHNCATSSINLEPNGDLYICQDMADSKNLIIGNAIKSYFDYEIWGKIKERSNKLSSDCLSCDYFKECQGGCMLEAIQQKNDIYGKTNYCQIWKKLFKSIDNSINEYGIENIENWLQKISRY